MEKFGPQSERIKARMVRCSVVMVLTNDVDGLTEFLVEATKKVGIEGAAEFLDDPNKGVQEVYAELEKYSDHITGIPYYVVCDSSDGSMEKQARWPNPRGLFARAFRATD
ncbi:hypothetical protein IFM89_005032 [Coptis chinensis]|uniref:Uncharacterized protein n=1 Tax=Coptis chinensis TaxID=261450 RepID=A0A835HNN3_9MAGN|nr:hypothetical protein IFM89_005032 [Coptis chinensis]